MNQETLIALTPEAENKSLLIYEGGNTAIHGCSPISYLQMLDSEMGADMQDSRERFNQYPNLGIRLSDGKIYLKMRFSNVPPIYGYVLLEAIDKIFDDENDECILYLTDGQTLPTRWRIGTVSLHMRQAQKLLGAPATPEQEK